MTCMKGEKNSSVLLENQLIDKNREQSRYIKMGGKL